MKNIIAKTFSVMFLCIATIALIISGGIGNTVNAYNLEIFYFVDSGKHMDYSGSTKYQLEDSIKEWNSYKYNIIRKKAWNNIKDLTISDYYDNQGYFYAITIPSPIKKDGTGRQNGIIQFNKAYMDNLTTLEQNSIVMVQLGYALGLSDNKEDATSVMYYGSNKLKLSQDDKLGLEYLYDNVY